MKGLLLLIAALSMPAVAHAAPSAAASKAKNTAPSKTAKPKAPKPKGPCFAKPIQLARVRGTVIEPSQVSVTYCDGKPNLAALDSLSLLARPRDVERPSPAELSAYAKRPVMPKSMRDVKVTVKNAAAVAKAKTKYRDPLFVTEHVMRVDPGLLERLQKVANHYPGKSIEIISGYRPDARETSRHHHGRALDMRVNGVTRENLRDYVRTFEKTGCGYYPNSYFVHMDVRDEKGFWIDRAGPGEKADYGPWPAPKHVATQHVATQHVATREDKQRESVLQSALAAVSRWGSANTHERPEPAAPSKRVVEPEQEPDDMSEAEIKRVRAEARRALEQL